MFTNFQDTHTNGRIDRNPKTRYCQHLRDAEAEKQILVQFTNSQNDT